MIAACLLHAALLARAVHVAELGCSPVVESVRASDLKRIAHSSCVRQGVDAPEKVVMVTSVGAKGLIDAVNNVRRGQEMSLFSRGGANMRTPLWLWHEITFEDSRERRIKLHQELEELKESMAGRLCAIDLFAAVSWLMALITDPSSCIDAFYRIAGEMEPFEGQLRVMSGKLLVRKVAALYARYPRCASNPGLSPLALAVHAVHEPLSVDSSLLLPAGHLLLWVDVDVRQAAALDDRFIAFAAASDVSHIPFEWAITAVEAFTFGNISSQRQRWQEPRFESAMWRVESGVLAIRVSPATTALLLAILQHYDGGAARLARFCLCSDGGLARTPQLPCREPWFANNLYLDDLFVWSLFMHAQRTGWHAILGAPNVTQGWFAAGMPNPGGCAPSRCSDDSAARLKPLLQKELRNGRFSGHGDPPGGCACPASFAADDAAAAPGYRVSSFNLYEYLVHYMGTGPYSQGGSSVLTKDPSKALPEPELRFGDHGCLIVPDAPWCRLHDLLLGRLVRSSRAAVGRFCASSSNNASAGSKSGDSGGASSEFVPLHAQYEPWATPTPGNCGGGTGKGVAVDKSVCTQSWRAFAFTGTLHDCAQRCAACSDCVYVTFSQKAKDCSLYAECDLEHLMEGHGYHSVKAESFLRAQAKERHQHEHSGEHALGTAAAARGKQHAGSRGGIRIPRESRKVAPPPACEADQTVANLAVGAYLGAGLCLPRAGFEDVDTLFATRFGMQFDEGDVSILGVSFEGHRLRGAESRFDAAAAAIRSPPAISWSAALRPAAAAVLMVDLDYGGRTAVDGSSVGLAGIGIHGLWADCTGGSMDTGGTHELALSQCGTQLVRYERPGGSADLPDRYAFVLFSQSATPLKYPGKPRAGSLLNLTALMQLNPGLVARARNFMYYLDFTVKGRRGKLTTLEAIAKTKS